MDNASVGSFDLVRPQGRLMLRRAGQDDVVDVRIRRAFPWSSPDRFVSIRGPDGKELVLLDDLSTLSEPLMRTIREALDSTSFIPRITHIHGVDVRFGHQQWDVETDRGAVTFRVQEREDIRFLPDGRFTLRDADGNLYEMPALAELDEHSRRAVEALV